MLSVLLATLLVCGSAWAAACDLSCGLNLAMSACSETSAGVAPTTMTHCHGMATDRMPGHMVSAACSGTECGHQVPPAERLNADSFSFLWSAPQPDSPGVMLDAPRMQVERVAPALPRGDPDGFDPLLVSLRL